MRVKSCEYTLLVDFDYNPGLSTRLLDQDGFPWETVSSKGVLEDHSIQIGIRPLRANAPTEVRELFCWDERLPTAMAHRVYDAMAHLEAIDWQITTVFVNPKDTMPLNVNVGCLSKEESCPEGHVMFSAGGFTWGPLPLSPLVSPPRWPFPGHTQAGARATTLTLTPSPSGHHLKASLSLGGQAALYVDLPWQDAIGFASLASKEGWEKATAMFYPHGARIVGVADEQG
jgi:hypothetical protein